MLYSFIAARDGDVIHKISVQESVTAAENWAIGCMVDAFGLTPDPSCDFIELCGETDGARLTHLGIDGVPLAAAAVVTAFADLDAAIPDDHDVRYTGAFKACAKAVEDLSIALG